MRELLYNIVQRVVLGDFTLAQCHVRGRDLLVTSITTLDERQREIEITCTSRQPKDDPHKCDSRGSPNEGERRA